MGGSMRSDWGYTDPCGRARPTIGGASLTILTWLISGLIIGAIAKFVMPGDDPGGIIVTILIGIAGAFVGGYLGQTLGWYQPGEAAGWIASIVGALLLLGLYRVFKKG
jgi:uncharacterized membrane protein YeaQ/YmgE (transglycosylase-associated protein family)